MEVQRGGTYSNSPLHTDTHGRTYVETRDQSRLDDFILHVIVMGTDGTHLDTLPRPSSDDEPPPLRAEFSDGDRRFRRLRRYHSPPGFSGRSTPAAIS